MPYFGKTPAETALQTDDLENNIVTATKLADDSVTLAKMAGGTDGNLISYDTSGNPVAIATGDTGQVLTSAGENLPPAFAAAAAGGAWNLIGTAVASASATLTVTGLDTTYDSYAIAFTNIQPSTDEQEFRIRLGDSGGIDFGLTDYAYHIMAPETSASIYSGNYNPGTTYIKIGMVIGSASGEGYNGQFFLGRGSGTVFPIISGTYGKLDHQSVGRGGAVYGYRKAIITLTQVQCYMGSGNIATGRMTVWGIAHA